MRPTMSLFPHELPTIPIYANDQQYLKRWGRCRQFEARVSGRRLDVFAGQYFDRFRLVATRGASGKHRLEAVVAAVDLDWTGDSSIPRRSTGTRRESGNDRRRGWSESRSRWGVSFPGESSRNSGTA